MVRTNIALCLLLGAMFNVVNSQAQSVSQEKQELRMADNVIAERLALLAANPYICTEQPTSCLSADGIELGMALVAARNTPASLQSFVRIHRFRLDGGYAETFDELLCEKSKLIEKYVSALDAEDLRKQCVSEFEAIAKSTPSLKNAKVDSVCASVAHIRSDLDVTLRMVKDPPKSCEP